MKNMTIPKSPVFYHIPKCAGTWFWAGCIRASIEYLGDGKIRQIDVTSEQDEIRKLRLLATGRGNFFGRNKNIVLPQPELESFLTDQRTTHIFALNIEPSADLHPALNYSISLLSRFGGATPASMLLMRHPFERVQSLFYYLRDVGHWEPTAGLIKSATFEAYIQSGECESNWLVRRLGSLADQDEVNEEALERAKISLRQFDLVGTTECMDQFFDEARTRFNITINPGNVAYFRSKEVENRNLVSSKTRLSPEIREVFNEINKYDIALYLDFIHRGNKLSSTNQT